MKKLLVSSLFLVALAGALFPLGAQDCPRPIAWWPLGPAYGIAVDGHYAYVGSGALLLVVDIENPDDPVVVAELPMDEVVRNVAIQEGYAYVATSFGGLVVVDITEPTEPRLTGRVRTEGFALRVLVRNNWAFVAASWGGVRVINISNPARPREIGALETAEARGLALRGSRLYVADGYAGLRIVDISTPSEPVDLGSTALTGDGAEALDVEMATDNLAVVSGSDGLELFNVSDPSSPSSVGTHPIGGWSVELSGGYAYVAVGWGSLQVIDITSPQSPVHVGGLEPPGDATDVVVTDGFAYIADGEFGLRIAELTTPSTPVERSLAGPLGYAWRAEIAREHLFLADGWAGLRIFDVSEPTALEVIATLLPGDYTHGVAVSGSRAYLAADWTGGLQIVDVSDPSSPSVLGALGDGEVGHARGVAVSGDYAYIGAAEQGLVVVDVSDATTPRAVANEDFDLEGFSTNIAVADDIAFVAAGYLGLRLVDVSDPTGPVVLSGVATDDYVWDVAVRGDYAFVAESGNGMKVIDVSDPSSPVVVAAVTEVGDVWGIRVDDTYAYLASAWAGLVMLDVTEPTEPQFAGWSPMPGWASDVAIDDGTAFVMGGDAGIVAFDTRVCGAALQADFDWFPVQPQEGQTVRFSDRSTGAPASWQWNFGDGSAPSSEPNPTHVYSDSGQYEVTLTVSQGDGASDSLTQTIQVREPPALGCSADDETLCLNQERFAVEVSWQDFAGNTGTGQAVPLTDDTGYFWFFDGDNVEVVVKVLDGTGLNGHYWVFYGALSNVQFQLTVTDGETGESKSYQNPLGNFASVGDTTALPQGMGFVWPGLELQSVDRLAFPASRPGVSAQAVGAGFAWSPNQPTTGQTVSFTDQSSGGPESWCWTFGDEVGAPGGCSSTAANPTHVYTSAGSYSVRLQVQKTSGTSTEFDEVTRTLAVTSSGPTCSYVVSPSSQWFDTNGGAGTINVSVDSSCSWSAASTDSWVSLAPPISGSGNGALSYTVPENTGGSRSGSITITGQGFSRTVVINQQGGFSSGTCQPDATTLCLRGDRFELSVEWEDFQGNTGEGQAVTLTSDTGYFWFFGNDNIELIVKVLDGSPINGSFWVFYGALSNVEFDLTVTDMETGQSTSYRNPLGNFASVGDSEALPGD